MIQGKGEAKILDVISELTQFRFTPNSELRTENSLGSLFDPFEFRNPQCLCPLPLFRPLSSTRFCLHLNVKGMPIPVRLLCFPISGQGVCQKGPSGGG